MPKRHLPLLVAMQLLIAGGGAAQEKDALFLPRDLELLDEKTVVGTVETPLEPGLSRIAFPGSTTTFYVIDEAAVLRAKLADRLSDIGNNDSDISIRYDTYRSEFVHLRLRAGLRDARLLRVEGSLGLQLHGYFEAGGYANGRGAVDYVEYGMPVDSCPGLGPAIEDMLATLQSYASSIGTEPPSAPTRVSDEFITDAISYALRVRMGRTLEARFSASENSGRALYDPAHAIMTAVRQCRRLTVPEPRRLEF